MTSIRAVKHSTGRAIKHSARKGKRQARAREEPDHWTEKVETAAQTKLAELEHRVDETHNWVKRQFRRLRVAERRIERVLDTTTVKFNLARLDARDVAHDLSSRFDRLRSMGDSLRHRASDEAGHALDALGRACNSLKARLPH